NAPDVAREVAAAHFGGTFVDGNAVAPATTRAIGEIVTAGGAHFVDGGIIGPPARKAGGTRLYLSGPDAADVAAHFKSSLLEAIVLDGPVGAASAIKMAYAGWNKGLQHLVLWVADVERSVRFYRDVVGFEIAHRHPKAAFMRIPGSGDDHNLGLFEQPGLRPPDERSARMYHAAWEVGELADLARA